MAAYKMGDPEEESSGLISSPLSTEPQSSVSRLVTPRRVLLLVLVLIFLIFIGVSPSKTGLSFDEDSLDDDIEDEDLEFYRQSQPSNATLKHFIALCSAAKERNLTGYARDLAAADCGWGYDYTNSAAKKREWKVYLYGESWERPEIFELSGCSLNCPASPKCRIAKTSRLVDLVDGDVVVIFQSDATELVTKTPHFNTKKQYKVLYWREAQMLSPSIQIQKLFDFEMGVHYYSGLINPSFLRRPVQLLSGAVYPFPPFEFVPFRERKFAMSIISHCQASSQRDYYIDHLVSLLGQDRIHRFGKCGDHKLPGSTINVATKLMSEYKFYLAFENTIEDGYVTEKLFFTLNVPVVPVYLGALNVPNVTSIPSFIKASDFRSPKDLAQYLLQLDSNEQAYMQYHAWRKDPSRFDREYLKMLSDKVAGPEELSFYKKRGFKRFPRTAQCCRLCDENFVKQAAETRKAESLVTHWMTEEQIDRVFFKGKMKI